jgi:hypothetical protein
MGQIGRVLRAMGSLVHQTTLPYISLSGTHRLPVQILSSLLAAIAAWPIQKQGRGHTKETGNRNFRELLSAKVEHMLLN